MGKEETDTHGNHCHFSMNMDFLGLALVVKENRNFHYYPQQFLTFVYLIIFCKIPRNGPRVCRDSKSLGTRFTVVVVCGCVRTRVIPTLF